MHDFTRRRAAPCRNVSESTDLLDLSARRKIGPPSIHNALDLHDPLPLPQPQGSVHRQAERASENGSKNGVNWFRAALYARAEANQGRLLFLQRKQGQTLGAHCASLFAIEVQGTAVYRWTRLYAPN